MAVTYTIGTLSGLTGLSQHTIRAWERRYNALSPERSDSNRRIYGEEDLIRLTVLKRVVDAGHSIGQVASLSLDELKSLDSARVALPLDGPKFLGIEPHLAACLTALDRLDTDALDQCLVMGAAELGVVGSLERVVIPLLHEIEMRWVDGSMTISQEHLASAVLRGFLDRVRLSMRARVGAPRVLITTPRNQFHEIGALMAAIVAATEGWAVTYLGPNLPATEIAIAVRQCDASAVGLSVVFPLDDASLPDELRILRRELGAATTIMVGGRGASRYSQTLEEIGAVTIGDFATFRNSLGGVTAFVRR